MATIVTKHTVYTDIHKTKVDWREGSAVRSKYCSLRAFTSGGSQPCDSSSIGSHTAGFCPHIHTQFRAVRKLVR